MVVYVNIWHPEYQCEPLLSYFMSYILQFFFHFGIIVVSRVMFLPWELQHAGNEGMSGDDMNTSASGLLSALRPLEYNLPPAMLMQRISRASVRAGELRVEEVCSCNNEDSSSHLCGTVIVFPDIWWCPWQLGGLHEVCSHVLGLVTSVAEKFNSDILSVALERLSKHGTLWEIAIFTASYIWSWLREEALRWDMFPRRS